MLYKTSFRCFQHDKLYSDYLSQIWQIWQIFLKHNHPHNLLNLRETKKQKAVQTEQLKKIISKPQLQSHCHQKL